MSQKAARRIQSSQDKKRFKGDQGFKSRAMKAAAEKFKKSKRLLHTQHSRLLTFQFSFINLSLLSRYSSKVVILVVQP